MKMRLLLAIYPPQSYLSFVTGVMRKFDKEKRNLRNIPLEQIHITVKLIGSEVSYQTYEKVLEILKRFEGQYTKPEIEVNNIQFGFPGQINPRHLVTHMKSTDSLVQLADEFHKLIKHLDLRDTIRWKDNKFNEFHVAISKLKESASSTKGRDIKRMADALEIVPPEPFIPEEIYLVENALENGAPKYKKLERILL